jgi:hypothetical protein
MIIHDEELALARAYQQEHAFEDLTDDQLRAILTRGRELFHWFKAHPRTHNAINLCALVSIFVLDYLTLLKLPAWFITPGQTASATGSIAATLAASAIAGSIHSYLLYSLGVFTLHEGAAHRILFVGQGWFAKRAQAFASQLCRVSAAEPEYYATRHMVHHAKFGTPDDQEFLNCVLPRRYFLTFLPLAAFINFSDFIIHRPPTYTRSRILSALISTTYNGIYAFVLWNTFGPLFTLVTMFVFLPHVGFYLDRLRQFTEHNLMPLDNPNGSRSFGTGFWGLLVGGGPWGSPCHWEHHLVPSLPWYQQLVLHRFVVRQLTPRQREQFLIQPVIGFPLLWWRLIRELNAARVRHVA